MSITRYSYNSGGVNQEYRKKHNAKPGHAARHIVPQKVLNKHNLPHSTGNLRLGSHNPRNVPMDNIIDNQVFNGGFKPTRTNAGKYISNKDASDRIRQQVRVIKQSRRISIKLEFNVVLI